MDWGLLGPEQLGGSRRTRSLGLGAAVRMFNHLAVPGLGGVWFAKQLFLATLGVVVAERLRMVSRNVKTIDVANAIEALACWSAFESNGWQRDSRLRGVQKLAGKGEVTFGKLRRRDFYVTQPMRMATVQALSDLGFVHPGSQRFNSFRCTEAGRDLIETATTRYRPYRGSVEDYLVQLATDDSEITITAQLQAALSPLEPLDPIACRLVRSRLCEGAGKSWEAARRKNGLVWVSSLIDGGNATWRSRPRSIDADHWSDLRLGSRFFEARDAAIDLLNTIETAMAPLHTVRLSATDAPSIPAVERKLAAMRRAAQRYLTEQSDPTEGKLATSFCLACVDDDPAQVIRRLVARDNRVLVLRGNDVVPGPAFLVSAAESDSDEDTAGPGAENAGRVPAPEGISSRIQNLYLFELDLRGELSAFLYPPPDREAA